MKILGIQTALSLSSIALIEDEQILFEYSFYPSTKLSQVLLGRIDELMNKNNLEIRKLHGIAVSTGPGSFTGIKTGVSIAKGLAMGLKIPLVGISTLKGLCLKVPPLPYLLSPMLPSRNSEVYTAFYRFSSKNNLKRIEDCVAIDLNIWLKKIEESTMFIGEGALRYRNTIKRKLGKLAIFVPSSLNHLHASDIAFQATGKLKKANISSTLNLEGEYLHSPVDNKKIKQ